MERFDEWDTMLDEISSREAKIRSLRYEQTDIERALKEKVLRSGNVEFLSVNKAMIRRAARNIRK